MKKLIVLISVFLLLSTIHTNEIKVNASERIKLPASITFENVQKINTQPVPVMLEKIEEIQDIKIKSPPPVQPNIKDEEKYTERTVFLLSDKKWKTVLKFTPVAVWGSDKLNKYPFLVYHYEEYNTGRQHPPDYGIDADSIVLFLQQYKPDRVYVVGNNPSKLNAILISQPPYGAGLSPDIIYTIGENEDRSFWKSYEVAVVCKEDDYASCLVAAQYGSYYNAPLVILPKNFWMDAETVNAIRNKRIIAIGKYSKMETINLQKISPRTAFYLREAAELKYMNEFSSGGLILVNGFDINPYPDILNAFFKPQHDFRTSRTGDYIREPFYKTSLLAPYLGAADHDGLMVINEGYVPPDKDCFSTPPQDRDKVEEQIEKIKGSVDKRIKEESTKPIKYLTIMATPFAIPDSKYANCDANRMRRRPVDNLYGNFYPGLEMAPLERKPLYRKDGKIYVLSQARESKEDEEALSMYMEAYNETTGIIHERIKLFDGGIVSHPSRYAYNYTVDNMFNVHLFRLDYWDTPYDSLEYIIIDENGDYRSKEISITGSIYSFKVKTALSGNIYVVVWSYDMDNAQVIITILGFNQNGDLIVENTIHPAKWLPSYDFTVNSDEEVYIITQGSYENILIKLDKQGNIVFTKDENDLLFDHGVLLAQIEADENGNLFLPGIGVDLIQEGESSYYNLNFSRTYFVKLGENGEVITERVYLIDTYSVGAGIELTDDNVLFFDTYAGNISFFSKDGDLLSGPEEIFDEVCIVTNYVKKHNSIYFICDWAHHLPSYNYVEVLSHSSRKELYIDAQVAKVGRIYGIDTSDVSSLVARTLFYEMLLSEDKYGISTGHSRRQLCIGAERIYTYATLNGLQPVCYVSECGCGCEPSIICINDAVDDPTLFYNNRYISCSGNGDLVHCFNELDSSTMPEFKQPPVVSTQYSPHTGSFWQGGMWTLSLNTIRKGAVANYAPPGTVILLLQDDGSGGGIMRVLFKNDDLGTAYGKSNYVRFIGSFNTVLIGYPKLNPKLE